ncbi:HTTM domain-containing protein [Sorangium sp. So ce1024]|uniref:HTTM domain-containing protein n=1 Tax=unclassified Sorangium TaxID=2621164 RepID=UPI003EFE5B95
MSGAATTGRAGGLPRRVLARLGAWVSAPVPALRLEIIRVLAPLVILGFMSGRLVHADEWLGDAGFRVPDLGSDDWRQPLYIPPLPGWAAWGAAAAMVVSGLMVSAGVAVRWSAAVFAACLCHAALADRLAAFTVSKLGPVVILALAFSPCDRRFTLGGRARGDRGGPSLVDGGALRFLQALLITMYTASGLHKLRGDWLTHPHVLWTHLHDSYQTAVSWALGNVLPPFAWTALQAVVLVFEALALPWFAWRRTRTLALCTGLAMHAMIGLMFGPVRWFSLLMMTLLLGCFLPEPALDRLDRALRSLSRGAE